MQALREVIVEHVSEVRCHFMEPATVSSYNKPLQVSTAIILFTLMQLGGRVEDVLNHS